jgi:hypothetical protein
MNLNQSNGTLTVIHPLLCRLHIFHFPDIDFFLFQIELQRNWGYGESPRLVKVVVVSNRPSRESFPSFFLLVELRNADIVFVNF